MLHLVGNAFILGLLNLTISCVDYLVEILGVLASWNTTGPSKPAQGRLRLFSLYPKSRKKVKLRFRWRTVQLVCLAQGWKGSDNVSTLFYRKRQIE
jgi:hypothetical protein